MLKFTAKFENEKGEVVSSTKTVIRISHNGSLVFEDGSLLRSSTFQLIELHPEIVLKAVTVTGKRNDTLIFWE